MEEDYNMVYGIDKLAELLIERGIEFYVKDETSLLFADGSGNPHECWMAGAEKNLVNVMIAVTPEQAISVPDLNGIIAENDMLMALCKSMRCALADFDDKVYLAALDETLIGAGFDLQELGIEMD